MIAVENFGNLNMNGDIMLSISSVYMFYVLVVIVSFLLIVDTPSFFLFVFPSMCPTCFSGHQRDDWVLFIT